MSGQAATIRSSVRSVPLVAGGAAVGSSAAAGGVGPRRGGEPVAAASRRRVRRRRRLAGSAVAAGSRRRRLRAAAAVRCRRAPARLSGRRDGRWAAAGRDVRRLGRARWPAGAAARPPAAGSVAGPTAVGPTMPRSAAANRASSSCRRRPPMPARSGSMAMSRRATAVRAAPRSVPPDAGLRDEPRPNGFDHLVQQRPRVAAALLESVEDLDARGGVAGQQRLDESVDGRGVGETEQVADGGLGDDVGRHRQQLVEDRLGVAHAAGGEAGDERERAGLDRSGRRLRGSAPACPRSPGR